PDAADGRLPEDEIPCGRWRKHERPDRSATCPTADQSASKNVGKTYIPQPAPPSVPVSQHAAALVTRCTTQIPCVSNQDPGRAENRHWHGTCLQMDCQTTDNKSISKQKLLMSGHSLP